MKLCLPILARTQAEALKKMRDASKHVEVAEVWLDQIVDLDLEMLLKTKPLPILCTVKAPAEGGQFKGGDEALAGLLIEVIQHGADYVDIPYSMSKKLSTKVIQSAQKSKVKTILSHHDFKATPSYPELLKLAEEMKKRGADIIKIACMAKSYQDTIHMIALAKALEGKIPHILIAMGEEGKLSRILTPTLGGEMMFAILSKKGQTAPGQLTVKELRKAWKLLN